MSGPVYCPEIDTDPPEKFYHTHVNFLATPKGSTHSHNIGAPVLFFAEISNDDEDKTQLCCSVLVPPPCTGTFLGFKIVSVSHCTVKICVSFIDAHLSIMYGCSRSMVVKRRKPCIVLSNCLDIRTATSILAVYVQN